MLRPGQPIFYISVRTIVRNYVQPGPILKSSIVRPPKYEGVIIPENSLLPQLPPIPTMPNGVTVKKLNKKVQEMRGPEPVHNRLIFGQYGVAALCGGRLKHAHLENIRLCINRNIDPKRMFAVWRIEPPWFPLTKKSPGHKLGQGRGSVKAYASLVKAGRIIFELGGYCEFDEVVRILDSAARMLPIDAIPVHYETYNQVKSSEERVNEKNYNPLTLEHAIRNNFRGCRFYIGQYDDLWFGRYN